MSARSAVLRVGACRCAATAVVPARCSCSSRLVLAVSSAMDRLSGDLLGAIVALLPEGDCQEWNGALAVTTR